MSLPANMSSASPRRSDTSDTRLPGRWLWLARVGWVVLVICTLALFVGSLPTYYLFLQQACVGVVACQVIGNLDAAGVQALQAAGFTLGGYAAYAIILALIRAFLSVGVGLVIFWRRSDDWVALLGAFALVMYAVTEGGGGSGVIVVLAFVSPVWTLPAQMIGFLGVAAFALLVGLFPNGRFAPRWVSVAVALLLIQRLSLFLPTDSPLTTNNWPVLMQDVVGGGSNAALIFAQLYRYRRLSTPVQRQQIKWATFGIGLTLLLWSGVGAFESIVPPAPPNALLEAVYNTLWTLTSLPIPIFFGLAILRSRLWDIDTIINKALVYGLLTGLLGTLYAGLIIGLESVAGLFGGQAASNPVVLVLSTLAIATLFLPVRRRIQTLIDRRLYRQKYDAAKTLEAFSATLRQETDLEHISQQLIAVVQQTMQPAHVSLWLRQPERPGAEMPHRLEPPGPVSTEPSDG